MATTADTPFDVIVTIDTGSTTLLIAGYVTSWLVPNYRFSTPEGSIWGIINTVGDYVNGVTTATLFKPWSGTALVNAPALIEAVNDRVSLGAKLAKLIVLFGNGVLRSFAGVIWQDGDRPKFLNGVWTRQADSDLVKDLVVTGVVTEDGASTLSNKTFNGSTYFPSGVWASDGKLGIGTTNPASKLEIQTGNSVFEPSVHVINTNTSAGARTPAFEVLNNPARSVASVLGSIEVVYRGSGVADMSFYTNSGNNPFERMRILGSGYVGIGSTNPAAKLQVGGADNSPTPSQLYLADWSPSTAVPTIVGNWVSSGLWALGPASGTSDSMLRLGGVSGLGTTWNTARVGLVLTGSMGIGTTNPVGTLTVYDTTGVNGTPSANISSNRTDQTIFRIDNTTTRNWEFAVAGSSNPFGAGVLYIYDDAAQAARLSINASGGVRLNSYGAGTLVTDAVGNITASSDESLKVIVAPFTASREAVSKIEPILYHYSEASGLDTKWLYAGLGAGNVLTAIPCAIGVDRNGKRTLDLRPIVAALVNDNNDMAKRIDALEAAILPINGKQ